MTDCAIPNPVALYARVCSDREARPARGRRSG